MTSPPRESALAHSADQGESTSIEQAVYTSAQTGQGDGYQIVAASPGLSSDDARALVTWCPSHDAMLDLTCTATCVNFHPLPSGSMCVSRTQAAGAEYSGRGGRRLHTHCLITPPAVLARFGNDPFALLRAAIANGAVQTQDQIPPRLPNLQLPGRAPAMDRTLLARLNQQYRAERMSMLVHLALSQPALGLVVHRRSERVMAGLLSCLPVECRSEFSLTTGLKFSPRRRFRWMALANDRAEQRRLEQQFGMTIVDLDDKQPPRKASRLHGWASLVGYCMRHHRLSQLEAELNRPHEGLRLEDLSELGEQCKRRLSGCQVRSAEVSHAT